MFQYDKNQVAKDRNRKLIITSHNRRPISMAVANELAELQRTFERQVFNSLNNGEATVQAAVAYITFNK